jgi:hypothetical protein
MPEFHCGKCGTITQPTDLFCRICGSSLDPINAAKEGKNTRPEQGGEGLDGGDVIATPESAMSIRNACLLVAALLFSTLVLVMIFFIFLGNQSSGRPAFAIEIIGTPTLYPTSKPYSTATPYQTATPYPSAIPYPTTGVLAPSVAAAGATKLPFVPILPSFGSSGCELRIKNQNTNLDSVIILSDIDTNFIAMAVYVRASDSLSKSGISTGTYYTYVATGRDWDNNTGRFNNNAMYYRFEEPTTFDACSSGLYGRYQYLEITLNITEGSGSNIISVPADSFPSVSP